MATTETAPALLRATDAHAAKARAEAELAEAQRREVICKMHESGVTQQAIANELHVSQPYINRIIRSARAQKGKTARQTPLDIARLYAAGLLDRDVTCELLIDFDYQGLPVAQDERLDIALHTDHADLVQAYQDGYVDQEMYEAVARTLIARGA